MVHEIVLRENVIACQTSRLALRRNCGDPFNRIVFRSVVAAVFHVVPHAEEDREKFPVDLLVVVNGVDLSSVFEPPVALARIAVHAVGQIVVGADFISPLRRVEWNRASRVNGAERNGRTHCLFIRLFRRKRFPEFTLRLASHAVLRACGKTDKGIAGTVREKRGFQHVFRFTAQRMRFQ